MERKEIGGKRPEQQKLLIKAEGSEKGWWEGEASRPHTYSQNKMKKKKKTKSTV